MLSENKSVKMASSDRSPYYADLQTMLDPFLQAFNYAKHLGNISVKKPHFDLRLMCSIHAEEIEELLDGELSRHPHKS